MNTQLNKGSKIKFKATKAIWKVKRKIGCGYDFIINSEECLTFQESDWINYMILTGKAEIIKK